MGLVRIVRTVRSFESSQVFVEHAFDNRFRHLRHHNRLIAGNRLACTALQATAPS